MQGGVNLIQTLVQSGLGLWETSMLFSAQLGKVSKTFPVSFPTRDISQHPVGPHATCLVSQEV